jgi:FkbM family methyltransferase
MTLRIESLALRVWMEARGWRLAGHEPELRLLPYLVDPRRAALDVGANRGLYTTHLRRCARAVFAFEPLPHLARRLGLAYPDVTVQATALSDAPGTAELRVPGHNFSWATVEAANPLAGTAVTTVQVPCATLDSLDLRDVGFIKIDVEGHELAVLRGATATLAREAPTLLVEIEERHSPGTLARAQAWLQARAYRAFFLDAGHLRPMATFDRERDQRAAHVSRKGKVGRYINNFICFPERHLATHLTRLQETAGISTPPS